MQDGKEAGRAFHDDFVTIHHGDAWELASTLPEQSVHTIVTSPPYWGLRDYGEPGQFGLDLVGIPWRVAFALQADGWYLRSDIIWHKPNPMPESVTDRPTKAHEYVFLLSKSPRYYYDHEAIKEDATCAGQVLDYTGDQKNNRTDAKMQATRQKGRVIEVGDKRNKRSVWTVTTKPFSAAHFAVFPPDLIKPCILAGCPEGGTVLDPFMGSGTTAQVARSLGRKAIGFELNAGYIEIAAKHRLAQGVLL